MLIADIIIGDRHRKDLGDIEGLAQSIKDVSLLHPVVVRPDNVLIAGWRRIKAFELLGRTEIPVTVVDLESIARGEHAENVYREDFTSSEAIAIGQELEPMEKAAARERQGTRTDLEPPCNSQGGSGWDRVALVRVAKAVGMSRSTYVKAKDVVEAAETEPEKYGDLVETMDRTNVTAAHRELKKRRQEEHVAGVIAALPDSPDERYELLCGDLAEVGWQLESESVDIIITDPPYSREFLPLYETLARLAMHVLKPGGSLLAMAGQSYLPQVIDAMATHLRYHWTLAYLTPGGMSASLWQRKVNTFWKPVLWFVKGDYEGGWIGDVAVSAVNDDDKRFHDWGQSESGMKDLLERFTSPGDLVLDPFCGGGTTGVVAVALHRRFIGIDVDEACVQITRARLTEIKYE